MGDCPICCETFNKGARGAVTCECTGCEFTACKGCVRTYLLSTTADPACMECHKAWSQRFLTASLNRSFMTSTYRTHRAKVLAERERARLQDSIQDAQRKLECEAVEVEEKEASREVERLRALWTAAQRERSRLTGRRFALQRGVGGEDDGGSAEKRQFIMPCPAEGCRGFLSSAWKCGLCDVYACKDCFEAIGYNKTDAHACNPDSVASAEAIRKETRPCPTCGVRIYKIHGCDQMWCTQCKVAFSWKTGKKSGGNVHNPHYLEWQRTHRQNGGVVRAPGDVVCGGLPDYYECDRLRRRITSADDTTLFSTVTDRWWGKQPERNAHVRQLLGFSPRLLGLGVRDMYRVVGTVVNTVLPGYRESIVQLEDTGPIRVQYLLKRIDESQMERLVFSQDAKRRKTLQVLHVLELVGAVGTETFNEMTMPPPQLPDGHTAKEASDTTLKWLIEHCTMASGARVSGSAISQNWTSTMLAFQCLVRLEGLFHYCNSQLAEISSAFNLSVPCFKLDGEAWRYPACEKHLAHLQANTTTAARRAVDADDPVYVFSRKKYGVHEAAALSQHDGATENVKI